MGKNTAEMCAYPETRKALHDLEHALGLGTGAGLAWAWPGNDGWVFGAALALVLWRFFRAMTIDVRAPDYRNMPEEDE